MKKTKKPEGISAAEWKAAHVPEASAAAFAKAQPAASVFPEVVAAYKRSRGKQRTPTKVPVSIRLSRDVLKHFQATGTGWQTRLDDALRLLVGMHD